MNINVVISDDSPSLEGHENISIPNLGQVPNSICRSIILSGTLNFLNDEQILALLSKLRHGGAVSITCPDAMQVAHSFCLGRIDLMKFSEMTANRLRSRTLEETMSFLQNNGYQISSATVNDLMFHVEARRP